MKKTILLLLIPVFSFGQKSARLGTYSNVSIILNRMQFFGAGANFGVQYNNIVGVGAGFERYQKEDKVRNLANPVYFDARYFIKTRTIIKPFIALNIGKYIWKAHSHLSTGSDYIESTTTGRFFSGGEIGVWFSKINKNKGAMISVGIKDAGFITDAVEFHVISSKPNGDPVYLTKAQSTYSRENYGLIRFGLKL